MIPRTYGLAGQPIRFRGTAYDFGHSITAVQFSLDEGRHWTTYATPGTNDYQNVVWTFDWTPPEPGLYRLRARSVSDGGETSPEAALAEVEVGA